ncbi:adenylate/guanylate cyclase domain-containing protein [Actinomycetospora straminea]|uniref:Adenylate/guanylate cyclase domain-containing protein n=1 Tax=Actinomycetospora straminea TaxID=663607 RepID=A0ABP9DU39_9PSEU|nr:adenylate/guanylate cyclase domain-containing protein [Actinomycetospora straminea]MDD7935180.1 adenylate/guanylate cyclase domain-containing protein [Actinomycetospora straminea]
MTPGPDPASPDPERWARAQERIEDLLLRGPRTMTRGEVQQRTGFTPEHTARLWSALGFPATADDVRGFAEADVDALELSGRLLEEDTFDEAEELAVARALGQGLGRLAEWQATLVRRTIADTGKAHDPDAIVEAVEALVPTLEKLQSYVWRRHLAVTAGRMLATLAHPPEDGSSENRVVVGFADIVGFTSLSRKVDEVELRALLERFETVGTEVVARRHGRIVKTLGDEILFVADRVEDAVDIAFRLHDEVPDDDGHPALRVGLALGEVLPRYGDVYGPVVNIASRLTSEARPGTVLIDEDLTEALRATDLDLDIRAVPQLSVRGYRHLRPHVVRERG